MRPAHLAIANLLGNPHLTQDQIAQITGTSAPTVQRVARKIRDLSPETRELSAYRTLIRKRIPALKRVEAVEKVLEKVDSNPFAAMRAVEYVDGVLGLAPKQQSTAEAAVQQGPTIIFPVGSQIDIGIRSRSLVASDASVAGTEVAVIDHKTGK